MAAVMQALNQFIVHIRSGNSALTCTVTLLMEQKH